MRFLLAGFAALAPHPEAFMSRTRPHAPGVSRRRALQVLAAFGVAGPASADLLAQTRKPISVDILRRASAVVGDEFSDERLKVIEAALQRNLDQFQIVRDLEIDDRVEPAPVFNARLTPGR
jgi:hypothetical protein